MRACDDGEVFRFFVTMSVTKILWSQILLVSLVVLAFVWTATELTAWRLGFQPQLGAPWFELFGWPVYQPPAFLAVVLFRRLCACHCAKLCSARELGSR
jgi:type IV secretory pathway TraG/TraD family ATPase VirD4